jgi:sugar phosphate isomerase/epimerase
MLKYAYNMLVYGTEPIELGIARLAKFGYDYAEIVGEPTQISAAEYSQALSKHNMPVSSIVSIYTPERDLVSSNPAIRANTVAYIKGNVDFAAALGAKIVTLTPTACMKIKPEVEIEQEWAWAVAGAREAAQYALDHGVRLALEPWNRYESYLVNRLDQSIRMVDEVDNPGIGVMADTFHMSIEDKDIPGAIRSAGKRLAHVHLADSNRAAPGEGFLDFTPIVEAIRDVNYQGVCSFELLPAAGDIWGVLQGGKAPEFLDPYTESAIKYMKNIEKSLGMSDVK